MAFSPATFIPLSSMANSDAPRIFSYATGDTLATANGDDYFNLAAAQSGGQGLKDLDVIYVNAVDGFSFLSMTITAGAADVAAANDFV